MKISVIIPVHEFNEVVAGYLDKAIESVFKQERVSELPEVLIVSPLGLEGLIECCVKYNDDTFVPGRNPKVRIVNHEGSTDYQSQVNVGVNAITTDYFTVLEYDDEFSTTYFRNACQHVDAYPDVDVFLSMMIEVNSKNEGIKLTNETVWAQQFVGENGEMGYLNAAALKQYTDFKLSGAVIKKSEFKNIGGYKSNVKLTFMYEFLLRALNNACKIFTIPKIGYKHLATREGSLFDIYLKTMPVDERKFWFEVATKEANFTNDRPIDMSKLALKK